MFPPRTPTGLYGLAQSVGIRGDRGGAAPSGAPAKGLLCVACSPDGFMVLAGCSDSTVRVFSQDTTGLRRAVHVSARSPATYPSYCEGSNTARC